MAGERILVVDDERGVRETLAAILTDDGYDVECVETGEEGIAAIEKEAFDAVLLDVWLPGIDGLETLGQLRDLRPDTEVVMISGHGTVETAVRATRSGAFDFIEKPLSLEKTLVVLRNALRQRRLERRNRALLAQLARDTTILGKSAGMERLRREVEVAGSSDAPVLIMGAAGGGRETVARRIHASGSRANRSFIDVPCAALHPDAAATLLFRDDDSPSRIRLASGGTLYLADVDRLPEELQQRLAAMLVGISSDENAGRVIASAAPGATDIDATLLNYLDVIRLNVPLLRERREDIPELAERFMVDLAREYGRTPRRLAPDSLAALKTWDWPGDLRELKNLIERLLLLGESETVCAAELPGRLGRPRGIEIDLYGRFTSLEEGVAAFERHLVHRTLIEVSGDRDAAATRLGLSRADLERRLESGLS